MHLLHLHWLTPVHPERHGRLFVWAETDTPDETSGLSRKKQAPLHPRQAGLQTLPQVLAPVQLPPPLPAAPLAFWLPANRSGPVPPPDLGHNWEAADDPPTLRQWTINGLVLDTAQALTLFTYLQQHDLPPALRLGPDARYWQAAFAFVLELLAHH